MAQKLVKIAKEFNLGTTTIVEFLTKNGYEIDNKPTSKISEEMYDELLKEFKTSHDVKAQADQVILGHQRHAAPKEKELFKNKEELATPEEAPVVEEPAPVQEEKVEEVAPVQEEKKVEEPAVEEVIEAKKIELPGIKVVDKIDLEEKKVEPPVVVEEKKEEPVVEEKPKEVVAEKKTDEIIRAEIPTLSTPKTLGKIDMKKFEPKKKKEAPAAKKDDKKNAPVASSDAARKRRRRKRKKVPANQNQGGNNQGNRRGQSGRGGRRDEVKEVSAKEIEEKIKATMARMSGGGKNKRQKIRRDNRADKREKQEQLEESKVNENLQLTEFVSVSELASLMGESVSDVITTCVNAGVMVSINQRLDAEIIELVAEEFGHKVEFISAEDQDEEEVIEEDDPADLVPRAPIVTVMGHVDHGKTSLLDYIREATVAEGEAGGITQHIGAYEVLVGPDKKKITFLDTPGHEAFTAMRARGAKVTDVVIIIVAADDSIMPQTREAISHSQAAGVPMVFAINKIDKAGANPERIKQELSSMNLLLEEWGGTYQSQDISAKTGEGIEELLEKLILEAEVLELKANPSRSGIGTVIEASLDKGRGHVTKLLVQNGSIKIGDALVAGAHSGKIKAMFNDKGEKIKTAGPSEPVLMLGLGGSPQAGEKFKVADTEQEARQIAMKRSQISREQSNRANKRISLDEIGRRIALGSFKELNLIVKGDVDGSIEALSDSLIKLSVESIQVRVIHKAVGQIVESDVLLASASDAIIIGFQVRPSLTARKLAEREMVEIKTYSVIYEAIEEIQAAMEGMLDPEEEEKILGQVEVREVYKISKVGSIAGCYVQDGMVKRNNYVRVIRDGIVIYPTKEGHNAEIASLKRFKDDVKEVKNNMECGIQIKNFNDIKIGDNFEIYEIIQVKQTLGK